MDCVIGEAVAGSRAPRRFYGRRAGRALRPGRRTLLLDRLPQLAVVLPHDGGTLQPHDLFGRPDVPGCDVPRCDVPGCDVPERDVPVWLEIGFGAGEHLIGQALAHPAVGFIGCEPYINGVAALLRKIDQFGVSNIRVHPDDARPLLQQLAPGSLQRAFMLFADPWPKRRHHGRRFMQPETVALLARALRAGGDLTFATDHPDYGRWTLGLMTNHPAFRWCARRPGDWRHPPADWVGTRYEAKALARGTRCIYLRFQRISTR